MHAGRGRRAHGRFGCGDLLIVDERGGSRYFSWWWSSSCLLVLRVRKAALCPCLAKEFLEVFVLLFRDFGINQHRTPDDGWFFAPKNLLRRIVGTRRCSTGSELAPLPERLAPLVLLHLVLLLLLLPLIKLLSNLVPALVYFLANGDAVLAEALEICAFFSHLCVIFAGEAFFFIDSFAHACKFDQYARCGSSMFTRPLLRNVLRSDPIQSLDLLSQRFVVCHLFTGVEDTAAGSRTSKSVAHEVPPPSPFFCHFRPEVLSKFFSFLVLLFYFLFRFSFILVLFIDALQVRSSSFLARLRVELIYRPKIRPVAKSRYSPGGPVGSPPP
mmetsp:Transcript_19616/g.49263  ORF Transcript_19616/g.49263 Transcript_19616/m.49263 type:complete len:328 (-) Transcript_19616:233-1216(-)